MVWLSPKVRRRYQYLLVQSKTLDKLIEKIYESNKRAGSQPWVRTILRRAVALSLEIQRLRRLGC